MSGRENREGNSLDSLDFCRSLVYNKPKNKNGNTNGIPFALPKWSWWRGLNSRPVDYESTALPLSHTSMPLLRTLTVYYTI